MWFPCLKPSTSCLPQRFHLLFSLLLKTSQSHWPYFAVLWMLFSPQGLCICCALHLEHSLPFFSLAASSWTSTFWLTNFSLCRVFPSLPTQKSTSIFFWDTKLLFFVTHVQIFDYIYICMRICLTSVSYYCRAPWGQKPSLLCSPLCPYHFFQRWAPT